jgi:hypothetical protein
VCYIYTHIRIYIRHKHIHMHVVTQVRTTQKACVCMISLDALFFSCHILFTPYFFHAIFFSCHILFMPYSFHVIFFSCLKCNIFHVLKYTKLVYDIIIIFHACNTLCIGINAVPFGSKNRIHTSLKLSRSVSVSQPWRHKDKN